MILTHFPICNRELELKMNHLPDFLALNTNDYVNGVFVHAGFVCVAEKHISVSSCHRLTSGCDGTNSDDPRISDRM